MQRFPPEVTWRTDLLQHREMTDDRDPDHVVALRLFSPSAPDQGLRMGSTEHQTPVRCLQIYPSAGTKCLSGVTDPTGDDTPDRPLQKHSAYRPEFEIWDADLIILNAKKHGHSSPTKTVGLFLKGENCVKKQEY